MTGDPLVTLPAALAAPGARRQARFLLGVDGGATKTLAGVLDLLHGSLHLGHGGPSNEDAVGAKAAVEALLEAAQEAIDGAGTETGQLSAAVLAIAGTDTDSVTRHVHRARGDSWIVVNDVVGAWATATGCAPGVAAIAGTGSNVFGVGEDGRSWRTGGWGHLLGDEGSGYWLGVESIRAALRDRDASGPPTRLGEEASTFFDVPSIEALASLVYSKPLTKGEIAAFAVRTAKLAGEGDQVARELFARGAQLLGGQIVAVIAQTGLRGSFPVGLIGSAYKAGPVFMEPLEKRVRQDAPQAQISLVEMAPVGGSLLLAARACGQQDSIQPAELTRLIESALKA
jgi:N-acetylglucosamine kinase-like BadF-type ATPase